MPVTFAGNLDAKLQEWALQPDLSLEGYELLLPGAQLASIETQFIDGLLWETPDLVINVHYVAGRFSQGGVEYRWIIPHRTMERIREGKDNVVRLNSALWELNLQRLKSLSVKIEQDGGKEFFGVPVSKLARCLFSVSSRSLNFKEAK